MDVNRTVLARGGGEKPIEQPRARRTRETLFEPARNARRAAALPLSPGAAARTSMFPSHHRRSEAQRGAIGAAGQPSQASDETLANRPRRKSRSAGWDASSSAIL